MKLKKGVKLKKGIKLKKNAYVPSNKNPMKFAEGKSNKS